jgi:hypothetical protein
METNIDLDHIERIEQLQYDAINFKPIPYLPLTIRTTPDGFDQVPMSEAYHNPELMLYNEILWSTMHSTYNSVRLKDDGPLMVRSNHGVGIIATMFGCESQIFGDQMPWVTHIDTDAAKKAFTNGVPDLAGGLGGEVCEFYDYFRRRLDAYPKCAKAIRLQQPDLQGPYDIMHLIIGNEAFLLPYDDPEFTREMLDIITQTYIAYRRRLDPLLYDSIHDAVFVHGFCVGGKVFIKADTATANLSDEAFGELEADYDRIILEAFADEGGGGLHTCGVFRTGCAEKLKTPLLSCLNLGNPERNDFNEAYEFWSGQKTALIGWGFNMFYDDYHVNALGNVKTGVTLMAKAHDIESGKEILKRHREKGLSDN